MTTTNLSDFGYRELAMLEELLKAMREQGLPSDFYDEENEDTSYYILCSDCGYDESEVE